MEVTAGRLSARMNQASLDVVKIRRPGGDNGVIDFLAWLKRAAGIPAGSIVGGKGEDSVAGAGENDDFHLRVVDDALNAER